MKRFIAVLTITLASASAFAENGKPFEQLDLDRALPNIPERTVDEPTRMAAAPGETRSDVEIGVDAESVVEEQATPSPFANDWNFIAPAL
jgi:hypothetical protein